MTPASLSNLVREMRCSQIARIRHETLPFTLKGCATVNQMKGWNMYEELDHLVYGVTLLARQFVVVVFVYFVLSKLLYLAFSAISALLCMPHPGMGTLVLRAFRRTAE